MRPRLRRFPPELTSQTGDHALGLFSWFYIDPFWVSAQVAHGDFRRTISVNSGYRTSGHFALSFSMTSRSKRIGGIPCFSISS